MQNYSRTVELTEIANNAAGASNKQFEKTQDSLESKLNKLDNAWTVFTTNIADSSTIKAAIDVLTKLLETINNIIESSGKLGPALQAGIAIAGAKLVAGSVGGIAPLVGQMARGSLDEGTTIGAQLGKGILGGIKKEFQGLPKIFQSIKGYFSKGKGFLSEEASKFSNVFTQDSINRTKTFTQEVQNLADTYDDWNDVYLNGQQILNQANTNIGKATSKITLFKTAIMGLSPAIPIIAGVAAVLGVVAAAYLYATRNTRALKKAQEELNEIQERRSFVESQIEELENAEELNDYERIKLELLKEQLNTILAQEKAQKRQVFEAEKSVNTAKGYGIAKVDTNYGRPGQQKGTEIQYMAGAVGETTKQAALISHNTYQTNAENAILELQRQINEEAKKGNDNQVKILQERLDLIEEQKEKEQAQYDEIINYYTQAWEDGILDREKDEEEFIAWQKEMNQRMGTEKALIYFSQDKTETEQKKIIQQYKEFIEKLSKATEPRDITSALNNLSKDFPLLAEAVDKAGISYDDLTNAAKDWRAESKQQINSITKLTQSFNDYLSQLGKLEDQISGITDLYKKFAEEGAVSASDLSKLGSIQIGGTDEAPILLNSISAWEQYSAVLSNSSSTISDVKDVTQQLTNALITQTDWIDFNEQKQQALVNSLKKLGVVNAQQIAEEVANRSKLTNELADIYGIDVKNYKTAAELKEAIDQKTNKLIIEAESKLTGDRLRLYSQDVENYQTASVEKLKILKQQLGAEMSQMALVNPSTNIAENLNRRNQILEISNTISQIDKIIAQKKNETDISSLFNFSTPKFDWSTFDKATSSATSSATAAKESIEELASVFYNLDDIINDTTNSLKNLQSEYDHLTSTESITQNLSGQISLYKKLIANTREEISVAEQLIKSYQKQAETLGYLNKYFTFSDNGSIRRTQAYYNLREKEDAAIIEALDKWINKYDELVSKQDELNQSLTDYHGELVSTWEQWRDSFISLINDLAQVYEEDAQNAIDAQKDKYDELKKLDDDYLERLKKNIQARRDARDKENQYNELAEKQSRLSLLMRDTSGMYAEEIAQLQKEITEAQQDISDSEVDSIIEKLEDEYDIQHQYWDRLIEKQQSQLDQMRENGEYLKIAEQDIRQNPDAVYEKMAAYWEDKYSQTEIVAKLEDLSQSISEAKQFLSSGASTGEEYAQNVGNQAGTSYEDQSHPNYSNGVVPTSISLSNGQILEGYIKNGRTYTDKELTQSLNDYLEQSNMAALVNSADGRKYVMLPGMTRGAEVSEVKKFLQNKIDWMSASASKKASLNIENEKFRSTYGMGADTIPYEDAVRYMQFLKRYKKGGLVDYTGMAWVDGTKSQPEAFLNTQDTRNLSELKEMLAAHFNSTTNKTIGGDCNIYVNVDSISSDYDIDQAINKIKNEMVKSSSYRNVNLISRAR